MMMKIGAINLIYAISFLDLFSIGLTFPLFTNHLRELGASHSVIGLCNSIYSGVQLFSGPIIGGWSDVRDRKSVLKVTLIICAISYGLLGLTSSIFFILILRVILGIVKHTQSICKAVISDLIPASEQTEVFGRSAALGSLGFIIGPFIGGHLSEIKHGFTYVSALTASLFLANFGMSMFLPEESPKAEKVYNTSLIGSIKQEFIKTIKELRDIDWKDSLCFGLTYPFLSTYIRSLGADHVIVGLLSVGYLLCNLISKTIEVPLTKSLGKKFCFIITLIIISISHFYLLRTSNYWIVIFSRCIHGAVVSHSQNLCKDILIQHVEDTRKEYALTVFNVLSGCGYIVGPILAGYLFSIKFVYISFLAFILSFINLCLAITVPNQDDVCTTTEDIEDSLSEKVCQNINDLATSFAKSDYRRNWDIMAMRFLHVSCVTIFFGKFSQILDYNFKASPVTLGYAYAYLNALTFC
ncbi:hypothetical protein NQ315_008506 [Exocentrus adspersus]|uniref:Major facilitator superfamily (MFS) profile domain-containing protein n=1 Tax=Exocentrus adspersus TaxID=1586481 RepID=A0AAV8W600_9CUCU|nr:hypothetical protein NQ315_008506 [Exocentrus adspersus]